jgi:hypothetical protein
MQVRAAFPNFGKEAALLFVCVAGCSAYPANENHLAVEAKTQPQWIRVAVAESAQTLESRCSEYAPLEIVYSDDALWDECQREAWSVVHDQRRRLYEEALNRCVDDAQRRGKGSCCFAKTTMHTHAETLLQDRCEVVCRERVGAGAEVVPPRKCTPINVSLPITTPPRAHTAKVEEIVAACRTGLSDPSKCDGLPSRMERNYCKQACGWEIQQLETAVTRCVVQRLHNQGDSSCASFEPRVSRECQKRCDDTVATRQKNEPTPVPDEMR